MTIQLKTLFTNYLAIELLIYVNHLSKKPILRKIKGKIYSWVYIHTKYTNICKKEAEANFKETQYPNHDKWRPETMTVPLKCMAASALLK